MTLASWKVTFDVTTDKTCRMVALHLQSFLLTLCVTCLKGVTVT